MLDEPRQCCWVQKCSHQSHPPSSVITDPAELLTLRDKPGPRLATPTSQGYRKPCLSQRAQDSDVAMLRGLALGSVPAGPCAVPLLMP